MANNQQFTNNAASTLSAGITSSATTITLATGGGALFPALSGSQYFYATLSNVAGTVNEIVKVTARTTDTLTVVRAQDNTTASAFITGDGFQLRATAAAFNNIGQLDSANTWSQTQTFVGPVLGTPGSGNLTNCTADGTNAVGFRNVPINSQSADYTTVLADSGKVILHPSSDANARTFTIDSNVTVAYPIGTVLTFINMTSQVVTIAITTDTMYLSGTGTTGSRALAQYGMATAIKMTTGSGTTTWLISGSGLT
jgi:hypothetical protein